MLLDQPMEPGIPSRPADWLIELPTGRYVGTSVVVSVDSIVVTATYAGAGGAGPRVSYAPPPYDILGANGLPLGVVTSFAIT
jgi:hypothetical protein